jgi:hypothetical protein
MLSGASLIGIIFGLTLGNFAFQVFVSQDWSTAVERSFFQCIAIFCVWISARFAKLFYDAAD